MGTHLTEPTGHIPALFASAVWARGSRAVAGECGGVVNGT